GSPSRSSVEARTACRARMSTSRPASHSPMPLRKAARTPLTLTEATRSGRGMAPSLLIGAALRGGPPARPRGLRRRVACRVARVALAATAAEEPREPVALPPLRLQLRADDLLAPRPLACRLLLALLRNLGVGDDPRVLESDRDP